MEITSSDFDGLRAVCGIKSIHQWRHVKPYFTVETVDAVLDKVKDIPTRHALLVFTSVAHTTHQTESSKCGPRLATPSHYNCRQNAKTVQGPRRNIVPCAAQG